MKVGRSDNIRLGRLPDRTPIKLMIALSPALHARLQEYAKAYHQAYGAPEPLTELIPYMLRNFVESDRAFARATQRRSTSAADKVEG